MKTLHFMYCPWTGLGLYNGFRGNRWLKNRIKVFKQFVIPSLQAQTCKDFTLWCSWRPEEKNNPHVKELVQYLKTIKEFKTVHTFNGVCFYDDKHEDSIARERLTQNLHRSIGELFDTFGDAEWVLMTIQPSDDLYDKNAVETLQYMFEYEDWQAIGFSKGYIMNYRTGEIADYNPQTNPPFYTIKFPKHTFADARKHIDYTRMKHDVGKYKAGTPLPSHEYVGDCLKYYQIDERGFMVGTHLDNISTNFNIPYKGDMVTEHSEKNNILDNFGINNIERLKTKAPLRKKLLFSLPYNMQRKIRYLLTEKFRK